MLSCLCSFGTLDTVLIGEIWKKEVALSLFISFIVGLQYKVYIKVSNYLCSWNVDWFFYKKYSIRIVVLENEDTNAHQYIRQNNGFKGRLYLNIIKEIPKPLPYCIPFHRQELWYFVCLQSLNFKTFWIILSSLWNVYRLVIWHNTNEPG